VSWERAVLNQIGFWPVRGESHGSLEVSVNATDGAIAEAVSRATAFVTASRYEAFGIATERIVGATSGRVSTTTSVRTECVG